MSKKTIYGKSFDEAEIGDKSAVLEALQVRKAERDRVKQLGQALREERTTTQDLRRQLRRLEEENRRLQEIIRKDSAR